MIKDIKYSGYSTQPSDYECHDGDLATSLNLISEDGQVKSILSPEILRNFGMNVSKVFIHKTSTFNHVLVYFKDGRLVYPDAKPSAAVLGTFPDLVRISSLGNVVLLHFDKAPVCYSWWDGDKEEYIFLGARPDPIVCYTEVTGNVMTSSFIEADEGRIIDFNDVLDTSTFKDAADNNYDFEVPLDKKSDFCNKMFGVINRMIAKSRKNGRFNFPFFIRFAYRLFDGSRIMFTAPHLIYPVSNGKPVILLRIIDGKIRPLFFLPEVSISFRFDPVADLRWKNLISHVDILVTDQIPGYTAADNCVKSIGQITDENDAFIMPLENEEMSRRMNAMNWFSSRFVECQVAKFHSVDSFNRVWVGDTDHRCIEILRDMDAKFAWINIKGYAKETVRLVIVNPNKVLGGTPYDIIELDTITPEVAANAYNLPVTDDFKIYKVDFISVSNLTTRFSEIGGHPFIAFESPKGFERRLMYCTGFTSSQTNVNLDGALAVKIDYQDKNIDYAEQIVGNHPFYLLDSIEYDKFTENVPLNSITITPDCADNKLNSIVTRENVRDDYRSGDLRIAPIAHNYNNRVTLGVNRVIPFEGDVASHVDFRYTTKPNSNPGHRLISNLYFEIFENSTRYIANAVASKPDYTVSSVDENGNPTHPLCYPYLDSLTWLFYPNINCRCVYLRAVDGKTYYIKMKKHDYLNGVYAFNDFLPLIDIAQETTFIPSDQDSIPANKLFTSEVNNPFYFPLTGINTVGTGRIKAVSTAAKALSEGQFGQFPLYAFTDEGVWALQVSTDGTYSARQPITRDVILANTDPLQMDSAVLFATDRGIMLISGSQTQCITDVINSKEPFDVLQLPGMAKLHSMLGHNADTCLPTAHFLEFIAECGMLYDYVHQRVIVYNPHYTYAYVYSLKSKEWGMMYSTIEAGINSYPEALAVDHNGALLNFSAMEGMATKGLLVSRPIKLETPDVLKTMDTVIQRGHFQKGHVQSVLYGSRDLFNWHLIWSSKDHYLRGFRGTPYKYFRIALLCKLAPDESIFGASLQFTPRLTDQPR